MAAMTPATTASAGAAHSVFVYGSLMADEVVSAILHRVPASSPALLTDYHRFNVKDRIYPAILPVESKKVVGKVIMGISDAELIVLDAFEDFEYIRRSVQISLTSTPSGPFFPAYIVPRSEASHLPSNKKKMAQPLCGLVLVARLGSLAGLDRPPSSHRTPQLGRVPLAATPSVSDWHRATPSYSPRPLPAPDAMAATTPATAASGGAAHSVFVYGSLMADEVVSAILHRVPASSPALLTDYHRFNVKDRIYPAILPVENKKVAGKVIMGISDAELIVLDAFEDFEYIRRSVQISLTDTSETMLADTYVWSDAEDPDLYGEWDFEEWKKLHMTDFLTMTLGFVQGLERPEPKTRVETYQSFMHELEQPESSTGIDS